MSKKAYVRAHSLLYDRIYYDGIGEVGGYPEGKFDHERFFELLGRAHVLEITNIAEHLWKDEKRWKSQEFPNTAPPFDLSWMEFTCPQTGRRYGVLTYASRLNEETAQTLPPQSKKLVGKLEHLPKWIVSATLVAVGDTCPVVAMCVEYCVGASGKVLATEKGGISVIFTANEIRKVIKAFIYAYIYPTLYATSVIHCHNTKIVENKPDPKASRRIYMLTGKPATTYKTVTLEPNKTYIPIAGSDESGISKRKAFHHVRGHFADYREKGLFGRVKGVFWMPPHHRGSPQVGIVAKDYEVRA